jgi:capsular polysaccharide export protein
LILYPTYVSLESGRFITPEQALDELLAWRDKQPVALPAWRQVLRFFLRQIAG